MIKASELRMNNWYSNGTGRYTLSTSDFMDFLNEAQVNDGVVRTIDPIPLTAEILEKCGFISKYRSVGYTFNKGGFELYNQDVSDYGEEIPNYKFHVTPNFYPRETATMYYLHQLQNLYYSLTGTELQVNL